MLFICFSELFYSLLISSFFFFNDTATTEIYTLSLHDALPIYPAQRAIRDFCRIPVQRQGGVGAQHGRSEEHTSELQSPCNLVCRLLLEKKKNHDLTPVITILPCLFPNLPHNRFIRHLPLTTAL